MLPILPTMGVGSYASPGWLISARKMLRRGELGERDIEELFDDALTVCIGDQLDAGVDILSDGELRRQRFVFELYAAGVIDVKNFHLESPARVAERIRQCLEVMPAEKLSITADCGFSALPRYAAREKMTALVAGTRLVRSELGNA